MVPIRQPLMIVGRCFDMKISIIDDEGVVGKALTRNYVDGEATFDTLREFSEVLLGYSMCIATYHHTVWEAKFNPYSIWNEGKIRSWKYQVNMDQCQILGFDFDDGTPALKLIEKLRDYRYVIAGSTSHMKEKFDRAGKSLGIKERFHVFLFLDKPVTDPKVYKMIVNYVNTNVINLPSDKSVLEASRYFKKHSCIISTNETGKLIEVDHYQKMYDTVMRLPQRRVKKIIPTKTLTPKWDKIYKPMLSTVGQRYNGVLKSAGYLKCLGFDNSEAYDIIVDVVGSGCSKVISGAIDWVFSK